MFTIIIPTWNNLALLQLCVRSIRENSAHPHQIVVHVNDGADGTLDWVREQGIEHTHSPGNIGICEAVNWVAGLARHALIVYMNDDMYCCPGWDSALLARIDGFDSNCFLVSATMIEPRETGNACVVVADFGRDPSGFDEAGLLAALPTLKRGDWLGATWPPTVVHREWWLRVGGYSSELSPGMSSDNDFAMKLWHAGCRRFIGIGDALVYHFQARSTGRIRRNDGRRQFLHKWGLTQSAFDRLYLRRGEPARGDALLAEPSSGPRLAWHRLRSSVKRRFF